MWVVGTDGSGLHKIVDGGRVWGEPHYSPDGSRAATITRARQRVGGGHRAHRRLRRAIRR
jgi:hypothetical protein